jgi:cellulose synthase/poly-beta-1,6-N-acetylglucosamine synthase-like glycosyltransferase
MLTFLNIPSFMMGGELYIGTTLSPIKTTLPIYLQLLFLIFFPTIAVTSRITFKMRAKILSFGLLSFVLFIIVQFLTIVILLGTGLVELPMSDVTSRYAIYNHTPVAFTQSSIFIANAVGSLAVEFMVFSTMTIPKRTKFKRIIKRRYVKEYSYLAAVLIISFIVIYLLADFLFSATDSSQLIANLVLKINITNALSFSYFIANFFYELKPPNWLKWNSPSRNGPSHKPFSVSFLVAAYNEEKFIKRCIESMDKAASKYSGKAEIILVNDGSTDNTKIIASDAIDNLKYSSGKLLTIPNSGKGFALAHGLEKTSGDIIFRTDADCELDENVLEPMMNHFKNPEVGCVSGLVLTLERKTIWQKTMSVMFAYYRYVKRAQGLVDSILAQPGVSTAFRRDAILRIGGWMDNIFGEDGEITNRMARYGYRGEVEDRSIIYSDAPETLMGLVQQRSRWGVAFYHSRGRNLELVRDFGCPRSVLFIQNLISHGAGFAHALVWPYLIAAIITGTLTFPLSYISSFLVWKLVAVQLAIYLIQVVLVSHTMIKIKRADDIKYFPVMRLVSMILGLIVKPQLAEVLLSWSAKWKEYNTKSFKALRKEVNRSVDPMYPQGD